MGLLCDLSQIDFVSGVINTDSTFLTISGQLKPSTLTANRYVVTDSSGYLTSSEASGAVITGEPNYVSKFGSDGILTESNIYVGTSGISINRGSTSPRAAVDVVASGADIMNTVGTTQPSRTVAVFENDGDAYINLLTQSETDAGLYCATPYTSGMFVYSEAATPAEWRTSIDNQTLSTQSKEEAFIYTDLTISSGVKSSNVKFRGQGVNTQTIPYGTYTQIEIPTIDFNIGGAFSTDNSGVVTCPRSGIYEVGIAGHVSCISNDYDAGSSFNFYIWKNGTHDEKIAYFKYYTDESTYFFVAGNMTVNCDVNDTLGIGMFHGITPEASGFVLDTLNVYINELV